MKDWCNQQQLKKLTWQRTKSHKLWFKPSWLKYDSSDHCEFILIPQPKLRIYRKHTLEITGSHGWNECKVSWYVIF